MINTGQYNTRDHRHLNKGKDQDIKDHWGSNYVYGNIVCKICIGTAGPDHSIYERSLLASILQREPTNVIIDTCSKQTAKKTSRRIKMNLEKSMVLPRNPI